MGILYTSVGVGASSASQGSGLTAPLPNNYISGLILANNSGDASNDIDIGVGVAKDGTNVYDLNLAASITKRLDATFVAGTNQGGLDSGAKAVSTWYHMWLIRKDSDGTSDVLFSTSATAPTMPSGYTAKRRIGAVRTNSGNTLIAFTQLVDRFSWLVPILDISAVLVGVTASLRVMTVPLGVRTVGIFNCIASHTANVDVTISSPDVTDNDPATVQFRTIVVPANTTQAQAIQVPTDLSSQIRIRADVAAAPTLNVGTAGWIDPRGTNG